jgi:protein-S-isoprenylcysteine O-methyltransferase Ste14
MKPSGPRRHRIVMPSLEHRIPPPVVAVAVAAAMWGLSSFQPALPLSAAVRPVAAAAFAIAGVAFDLLALTAFLRARTTINPVEPDKASALVTGGVYRVTRNPMYVGLALLLVAWAVHLSMLWPLAGPLLFVLYIGRFQIAPEERVMRQKFGDAYASYAARVRRWL